MFSSEDKELSSIFNFLNTVHLCKLRFMSVHLNLGSHISDNNQCFRVLYSEVTAIIRYSSLISVIYHIDVIGITPQIPCNRNM